MSKKNSLILATLCLAVVAAAGVWVRQRAPFNESVSGAASNDNPELLIVEKTAKGCAVKVQRVRDSEAKIWFELPKCPDETQTFVFDPSNNRVLVLVDGKYWIAEHKLGVSAKPYADAFKPPVEGISHPNTWFDRKSHALRSAALIEVPADIKDNPEGDEWRKKFPMLKDKWISVHTQNGAPPEGAPAIAMVAELNGNGQWQVLAEEKTTCCADMAPGTQAVQDFIDPQPGVYSLGDLLQKSICQHQACNANTLHPSKETKAWLASTFPSDGEESQGGFGYISLNSDDGFLFKMEFGDSLHAMNPVYYCKNQCAQRTLLARPESPGANFDQISLSPQGSFMLITTEYDGWGAKIYQLGSPKVAMNFAVDSRVVWVPKDLEF